MYRSQLTEETLALAAQIEDKVKLQHKQVDDMAFFNQQKVLSAFRTHQVSDYHLHPSSGYGYDDEGRDNLERVYAQTFGAEAAIVRPQIISGTTRDYIIACLGYYAQAMNCYILQESHTTRYNLVDGGDKDTGSLKDFHIRYRHIDLLNNKDIDWDTVEKS